MSVCLRYAYNREDAIEILNDGFMKVFEHIDTFDENKPFRSWFRRILVNAALDHFRSNKKFRLYAEPEENPSEEQLQSFNASMLDARDILSLFNRLPELQRITFNLYEVEGYDHEEIAGLLGISPGTSRSHLSRAKKALRALYLETNREDRHAAV